MCSRGWVELRRAPQALRITLAAAPVVSALFCTALVILDHDRGTSANYQTFTLYAAQGVLPVTLLLQLSGGVRYGAFERCRRDPTDELYANAVWLLCVALAGGIWATSVFAALETLAFGRPLTAANVSLLGMVFVQIVMMTVSVGLFVLLAVNCGLSFGQVAPPVIAFFALAKWLVEPFAGNWTRYVYYFWYPISPSWHTVLVQQIVPFCGYCLLLFCVNAIAFSRTDRLEA